MMQNQKGDRHMASTCNHIKKAAQCLAVMMIAGVCLASGCLAAEFGNRIKNKGSANANIMQINPPTPEGLEASIADVDPEDYFDVVGSLNGTDGSSVVIGDKQHTLASNVSASGIPQWSRVGIKLNNSGEVVEIEELTDEPH